MNLLRENLHRGVGGLSNPALYNRCNVGTKINIERYLDEVGGLACLPAPGLYPPDLSSSSDSLVRFSFRLCC